MLVILLKKSLIISLDLIYDFHIRKGKNRLVSSIISRCLNLLTY